MIQELERRLPLSVGKLDVLVRDGLAAGVLGEFECSPSDSFPDLFEYLRKGLCTLVTDSSCTCLPNQPINRRHWDDSSFG